MQIQHGDVKGERPSIVNYFEWFFWGVWSDQRGKSKSQAIDELKELVKPIFENKGVSMEDPKKAEIEAEYDRCLLFKLR